ncbi:hypothetical protein MKZ38_001513 [Zalerion maritima]|uniref:Uncharacterized protein n=1 Tax=Zalerion maritima TaxID=339359 RepID=A0AAD5RQ90_9PEZI|nr:hypothetical protein MKZ38_001513 [Zalerion maritima]
MTTLTPFSKPTPGPASRTKTAGLKIQTDLADKSKVDWRKPTANCPWEEINSAPGTKKEYGDADRHALAMSSSNWRAKAPVIPTIPESPKENGDIETKAKKPGLRLDTNMDKGKKFRDIGEVGAHVPAGIADVTPAGSYEVAVCDYGVAYLDEKLNPKSAPANGVVHALSLFELGGLKGYRRPVAKVEQVRNTDGTRPRSFDELDKEEKLALKRLTKFGLAGEVVEDFFGPDNTKSSSISGKDGATEETSMITSAGPEHGQEAHSKPDDASSKFRSVLKQIGIRFSTNSTKTAEEDLKSKDPGIVYVRTKSTAPHNQSVHNIERQGMDIMERVRMLASRNLNGPSEQPHVSPISQAMSGAAILDQNTIGRCDARSKGTDKSGDSGSIASSNNNLNPRASEFRPSPTTTIGTTMTRSINCDQEASSSAFRGGDLSSC